MTSIRFSNKNIYAELASGWDFLEFPNSDPGDSDFFCIFGIWIPLIFVKSPVSGCFSKDGIFRQKAISDAHVLINKIFNKIFFKISNITTHD